MTFQPSDLTGLVSWNQADTGVFNDYAGTISATTDGGVVSCWRDVSGSGNSFRQSNSGRSPLLKTNVLNGRQVLRFDASFSGMSGVVTLTKPYTCFVVYNYRSTTSTARRSLCGSINWLIGPYGNQHSFFNAGTFVTHSGTPVTQSEFVTATVWDDGATSKFFLNTVDKTVTAATGSPGVLHLAFEGFGGEFLDGDIAEVVAYDRRLTDADITQVHDYLGPRHALFAASDSDGASNWCRNFDSKSPRFRTNRAGLGWIKTGQTEVK